MEHLQEIFALIPQIQEKRRELKRLNEVLADREKRLKDHMEDKDLEEIEYDNKRVILKSKAKKSTLKKSEKIKQLHDKLREYNIKPVDKLLYDLVTFSTDTTPYYKLAYTSK